MSSPVITVRPEDRVRDAVALMATRNIGAVVVTVGDEPLGILTERDVVRKLMMSGEAGTLELAVSDIMSKPLITCSPDTTILNAFITMYEKRIRRLPVVEKGKLVGIVTERDLVYWVLRLLGYPNMAT